MTTKLVLSAVSHGNQIQKLSIKNLNKYQIRHEKLIGIAQPLLSTVENQTDNINEI